jgi:type I restriction enzyme S subunit
MFTYIDIGSIDGESNRILDVKKVSGREAPSRARQAVRPGDILFSTVRTYLRKIAKVDEDYENPIASTGFVVIRPAAGISSDFLLYQLLSPKFLEAIHALQTGTSYPAVRSSDVLGQRIVIPPLTEQRRIVAKLSASISALQRAAIASKRALERLNQYRTSVQYSAITGELTRQWRENHAPSTGETGQALVAQLRSLRAESTTEEKTRAVNVPLPFEIQDAEPRSVLRSIPNAAGERGC